MSQKKIILNMLLDTEWVCVTEMMAACIPDYRRRCCDLKEDGYNLISRPCTQHQHRSRTLQEWHLIQSSSVVDNLNKISLEMVRENKVPSLF